MVAQMYGGSKNMVQTLTAVHLDLSYKSRLTSSKLLFSRHWPHVLKPSRSENWLTMAHNSSHTLAHTVKGKAEQSKHGNEEQSSGRIPQRRACGQHRRRRNNKTNPSDKPHEHKRQHEEGERAKRVGLAGMNLAGM